MSEIRGDISCNLPAGTVWPDWAEQAWGVTLRFKHRTMEVPFFGGSLASEPTIAEVVECIASDCASVDNAADFYDWCDEMGQTPSRESQTTYNACVAQRAAFQTLMGDRESYDRIVFGQYA